jgi:hypothetical protein
MGSGDTSLVRRGISSDLRIGMHFLYAGTGYGGSSFPKDVKALVRTGDDMGIDRRVLAAVAAANDTQKRVLVDKVVARFGEDLQGRQFALWRLAFKLDTDDLREAPSRVIVHELLRRGAAIQAYDPVAMDEARRVLGDLPGLSFASHQADALLIATEWREFTSPDFEQMRALLKQSLIFDGRNLFDPAMARRLGLEYHAIGRGRRLAGWLWRGRGRRQRLGGPGLLLGILSPNLDDKTHLCQIPRERFDFLGYTFGRCYSQKTGRAYIGTRPSSKSIKRLVESITQETDRSRILLDGEDVVGRLNRKLIGWANYFCLGPVRPAYRAINAHVTQRLRRWLCKKHKVPGNGWARYPNQYLHEQLGLVNLPARIRDLPWAKA